MANYLNFRKTKWKLFLNFASILLLIFSVTPFKVDQNKNQNNPGNIRRWTFKDSRQDSDHSNFSWARYAEKIITQIYRDLYGDAMLVPIPDGHQHGGRKQTEISVTEFFYKSVNLSLEELGNIKIILFLIHELFR